MGHSIVKRTDSTKSLTTDPDGQMDRSRPPMAASPTDAGRAWLADP